MSEHREDVCTDSSFTFIALKHKDDDSTLYRLFAGTTVTPVITDCVVNMNDMKWFLIGCKGYRAAD